MTSFQNRRVQLLVENTTSKPLGASFKINNLDENSVRNLDGSIKKNTAFIRKLKTVSHEQSDQLIKELLGLKLEKYISEACNALLESKLKSQADYNAFIEISSLLFQRFQEFGPVMIDLLRKNIHPPPLYQKDIHQDQKDKEESTRISKQRMSIKILAEFNLVGIISSKVLNCNIINLIKELFDQDRELLNLPIAVSFLKSFEDEYFQTNTNSLVPENVKNQIKAYFVNYYESVSNQLVKSHQQLKDIEKFNDEYSLTKGDLSDERKEKYKNLIKIYEKLLTNTKSLAQILGTEIPFLLEEKNTTRLGDIGIAQDISQEEPVISGSSLWDDEETRSFYEDILDLKYTVPSNLLPFHSKNKEVVDTNQDLPKLEDPEPLVNSDHNDIDFGSNEFNEDTDELKDSTISSSTNASLEALFARLLNAVGSESIDSIAADFLYLNSKLSRNKLVSTIIRVPRQRTDLLPYYARLIATLHPYYPEIGNEILDHIQRKFTFHIKSKEQVFVEEKLKNINFMGELLKFKIAPYHLAFRSINSLLDDFTSHNIEMLSSLLETCGRYLYKNEITQEKIIVLLDTMMRKKASQHLDHRHNLLIDNAYFTCNPPESPALKTKIRPPIQLYLHKLIYKDLELVTAEEIFQKILKFQLNDPEIYNNLDCLAWLVAQLYRFYPTFGISVVDNTLEEIRLGLELNIFKHNQRRISVIRFLGELFNYCLISHTVIFDTLFMVLRFGHENGIPMPDVSCPADAPFDYFRIRLVCSLLECCGAYFKKGKPAELFDQFLVFFQISKMYILTKTQPPRDIGYIIDECFDYFRPKMKRFDTYYEAAIAVNNFSTREPLNGSDSIVNEDNENYAHDQVPSIVGQYNEKLLQDPEQEKRDLQDSLQRQEELELKKQEEQSLFELEFAKMINDSIETRKLEKKPQVFDLALPVNLKSNLNELWTHNEDKNLVSFSVLSKKGSKLQTKTMEIPADSSFVVNTKAKLEAEKEEKTVLKKIVLDYEAREREQNNQPKLRNNTNHSHRSLTESSGVKAETRPGK